MSDELPPEPRPGPEVLHVRDATEVDLDVVVEVVERAYRGASGRRGWTTEADLLGGQRIDRAMLGSSLADPATLIRVALDDGSPVGCYELGADADRSNGLVWFGLFAVDPDRQGRSIGARLLADAEIVAAERLGATTLRMRVIRQRSELIAWYLRRGYLDTGETAPFPYGDERFGTPRRPDLSFVVLAKGLREV